MNTYEQLTSLSPDDLKAYAALMIVQTGFILLGTLMLTLILYLVRAFSLSKIAKKMKLENNFAAFIPFGHAYVEGQICDKMKKKGNLRIHYTMLNITLTILNVGYMLYNTMYIYNTYYPIYETGVLDSKAFRQETSITLTVVMLGISLLTLIVSVMRTKALSFSYICFEKKKGFFLVFLSFMFKEITPFLYFGLSKLEPVNLSLDKFTMPGNQE